MTAWWSALFADLSPPRWSRCRLVLSEDAGIGATPQRWAKAASLRSRSGLSPMVTSSAAAVSGPVANTAVVAGATCRVSVSSWRLRARVPSIRCRARTAIERIAILVACVGS